jgi:integral membrane protein
MGLLSTPLSRLRAIGFAEGVSYLLLLCVAMPLKYLAGLPLAVKVTGWAHGVLFVAYGLAAIHAFRDRGWDLRRLAVVLAASLVPIGTFLLDRGWREEEERAAREAGARPPVAQG